MASLEVWGPGGHGRVALDGERLSVGSSAEADVVLEGDNTVSRLHAVLDRVGGTWCVRDVGSRNGTFVNAERLFGERSLRDRDEIRVGRTRLVFSDRVVIAGPLTEGLVAAPAVTAREKQVLVELCRPLLTGSPFTEPSSVREIAARLYVTEAAVKQHIGHLCDKFGILDADGTPRRVRLANDALMRGAVSVADLQDLPG
jgi:hypothetical protein